MRRWDGKDKVDWPPTLRPPLGLQTLSNPSKAKPKNCKLERALPFWARVEAPGLALATLLTFGGGCSREAKTPDREKSRDSPVRPLVVQIGEIARPVDGTTGRALPPLGRSGDMFVTLSVSTNEILWIEDGRAASKVSLEPLLKDWEWESAYVGETSSPWVPVVVRSWDESSDALSFWVQSDGQFKDQASIERSVLDESLGFAGTKLLGAPHTGDDAKVWVLKDLEKVPLGHCEEEESLWWWGAPVCARDRRLRLLNSTRESSILTESHERCFFGAEGVLCVANRASETQFRWIDQSGKTVWRTRMNTELLPSHGSGGPHGAMVVGWNDARAMSFVQVRSSGQVTIAEIPNSADLENSGDALTSMHDGRWVGYVPFQRSSRRDPGLWQLWAGAL